MQRGERNCEKNREEIVHQMDMSKKKNNFPFPSRVEGFLECCGEYIYE